MAAEQKEKEKKLGNSRWPNDVVSAALVRRLFICFFFLFFSFLFFFGDGRRKLSVRPDGSVSR